MGRIFRQVALAAVVGLAAAVPQRALAHGPLHVVCPRASRAGVKLDADIGAWDSTRFVRVDHTKASFGTATSDDDASFRFSLLWNASHLFLAVEVTDNSLVPAPTLARLYEGDCVEIGIDGGNDSEGGFDATDYQFVLSPSGPRAKPRVMLYRNPFLKIDDAPFVRCTANTTTKGYVIEAALSWKELGIKPDAGTVVGFQIAIRDYDADGTKKGITWAPASDPTGNPLRWGDLILTSKSAADVKPILDGLSAKNARWQRLLDGSARETDNDVTVDVRWGAIGRLSLGLGWNVQFRDGRFPLWDEGAWASFLEHLVWTRPGWIRYGVNLGHWEPKNDDGDPSHVEWSAFAFRSKAMQHHYRVLDVCQRNAIDVLWANWRIGDRATGAKWLAESVHKPGVSDTDDDAFNDAPYDPEEFAESLAACLYHLLRVRGYTCVKQVSLWNEPSEAWSYNSPSAKYPEAFWGYYNVLARHLRNLGLRDAVRILGPETSTQSYAALPWLPRHLKKYSKEVDILAHHDYIGFADYHRIDRGVPIGGARNPYIKLGKLGKRPVAVTELGNMGNGAEDVAGDAAVWAGSLSTARLVVEGINAGVAGFLRWEFKPYGVSWQNFGALTSLDKEHLFAPYRPVFFPHALLCRTAERGSSILQTTVAGGRDENGIPRVTCATLFHRDTGLAVLLVNDGFQPKKVTLRLDARFPASVRGNFGHLSYDSTLPATFVRHEPVAAEKGQLTITLMPRSIHALATRPRFATVPALPLLPRREEPLYSSVSTGKTTRHTARLRFGADYEWRVWQSTAGHTAFRTAPERGRDDNPVCRIAYDFVGVKPGERPEHVVAHTDVHVDGRPMRVQLRVNGDGEGHRLRALFLDAKGEVFEYPAATRIRWKGWQDVEVVPDLPLDQWNHWSGDGKMDLPLRAFGLSLTAPNNTYRGRGILEVDDVTVTSETQTAAE